jgi:hypothetical protein
MIRVIGAAVLIGALFVGARAFVASSGGGDEFSTRLAGQGYSPSLNLDIKINATKHKNGKVTGVSMVPKNFKGKAVELASQDPVELAQPGPNGYWCVNLSLKKVDEITNWLWFVKDVQGGPDQLSYAVGSNITCGSVGTPEQPFEPISSGDFRGEVK